MIRVIFSQVSHCLHFAFLRVHVPFCARVYLFERACAFLRARVPFRARVCLFARACAFSRACVPFCAHVSFCARVCLFARACVFLRARVPFCARMSIFMLMSILLFGFGFQAVTLLLTIMCIKNEISFLFIMNNLRKSI